VNRQRLIIALIATLAAPLLGPSSAQHWPGWTETFSDDTWKNPATTTANWDTGAGELTLHPFVMLPLDSLDLLTSCEDIAVRAGVAYIATQTDGLVAVKVSDPTNLIILGSHSTPGPLFCITLHGDLALVGAGDGLRVYDISVPGTFVDLGAVVDLNEYREIEVVGDYAYVAMSAGLDGFNGLKVIDISDPANPVIVGSSPTVDGCFGVAIDGDYAYVAENDAALVAFLIADPLTPLPLGQLGSGIPGRDVAIDGDYAYVVADVSGLIVADISDPANPLSIGGSAIPYPARTVEVDGDFAYIAHTSAGLQVYDVSAPTAPRQIHSYFIRTYCRSIAVEGRVAYALEATGMLYSVDIADKVAPPIIAGAYDTPGLAYDVAVSGDHAFVADEVEGLRVLDIGDPATPVEVGFYDTPGLTHDVEVFGNHAFLADGSGGMIVLEIFDPTFPIEVGSFTGAAGPVWDIEISGETAYVAAATDGLVVLDITTPSTPVFEGSGTPPDNARAVAVQDNYAYVADTGLGLVVVDVTDPVLPVAVGQNSNPTDPTGVAVSGDFAYVADFDYGLRIYDVSDPVAPTEIGSLAIPSTHAYDIVLAGNWAYVTDWAGLSVVDISDPTLPIRYDHADTPGLAAGLDVAGDYAFIGDLDTGVQVLQVYERDWNIDDRIAESVNINVTNPGAEIGSVALNTTQTGIALWQVSANGGADWTFVTPGGSWVDIPALERGSDLRWRANFFYALYDVLPVCEDLDLTFQFADDDFDGVPNGLDMCPAERASHFDFNRDGCLDPARGGRHIEYWPSGTNVEYSIHEDGIRTITDGSDFTAITASMDKWAAIAATSLGSLYNGTSTQDTAVAFDGINTITGADDSYDFDSHVIAVGITSSFTVPTYFQGKLYSPGEIVDADMIFNPVKQFRTDTQGSGIDLESVATHEAGHLYGLSHSVVRTSTMFYALGSGTSSRTLEEDDIVSYTKAYPDGDLLPVNYITGTVSDGIVGDPVAGAIVYAIDAVSGDTAACDVSLPDGSYQFAGLQDGDYYIAIHPFDQSAATYYMKPAWVNWYVDSIGVTLFVPEYWDAAESNSDNPQDKTIIVLAGSGATRDLTTNVDLDGPVITGTYPTLGQSDVAVETAVLIRFDEPIDHTTIQGNFKLAEMGLPPTYIGGKAYVMDDDSVISFRPFTPLEYATTYLCTLFTGIEDKYGNGMSVEDMFWFSTQAAPPLSVSSVVPNQGAAGSVIVLNGFGFDHASFGNNLVLFPHTNGTDTVMVPAMSASPSQIVATVPANAASGWVAARVPPETSAPLPFTVLPPDETPRGFELGKVGLNALPGMVEVTPDGSEAVVATSDGVSIVNVDPGSGGFTAHTPVSVSGGVTALSLTPGGGWIYGVERSGEKLHVVDAGSKTLVATLDVEAKPYGIAIEPGGNRAFIPTDDGEIQVWNIKAGSANFRKQVGAIASPNPNFEGRMAIDPAGDYLLAITGTGDMLAFDLGPDTFVVSVPVGPDPRDIVVESAGQRAYVSDPTGAVTVVSLAGMFKLTGITAGGSLRGMSMSPAGRYLFAANRELNLLDVIDLDPNSPDWWKVTTTVALGINPVDVDLTPDGAYAVSILEDTRELVVTAVGVGPVLESVTPSSGSGGAQLVLAGSGFGTDLDSLAVSFTQVGGGTVDIQPGRVNDDGSALTVTVPGAVASGPIGVVRERSTHKEYSNSQYFHALTDPGNRNMRPAAHLFESGYNLTDALAVSPDGDQLVVGTEGGQLLFFDIGPGSGTYHTLLGDVALDVAPVNEIVFTPDGKRLYASLAQPLTVYEVDANRSSATYRSVLDVVDLSIFPGEAIWELAASPDGQWLLAYNSSYNGVAFLDIVPGSSNKNVAVGQWSIEGVTDMAFHPGGQYAYCAAETDTAIHVIDMVGPSSPTFQEGVHRLPSSSVYPGAVAFSPSGDVCLALGRHVVTQNPYVVEIDATTPHVPVYVDVNVMGTSVVPEWQDQGRITVGPSGTDALWNARDEGFELIDLTLPTFPLQNEFTSAAYLADLYHAYTPDDSRVYAVGSVHDTVMVFDFTAADSIHVASGDGQTGIAGQALAAPLRVKVIQSGGGVPIQGVGVTFSVTAGGGIFAGSNANTQVAVTDASGIAEVNWRLGPFAGPNSAEAGGSGLVGTPVTFAATAQTDPATLPIRLRTASPGDGAGGVGVTTTVVANFSRGVEAATVSSSSFFVHPSGSSTPVPASVGFANDWERLSLTPLAPLDYSTTYEIEILSAIQDTSGNALENPDTLQFTTEAAPPPVLSAVDPPSATETVPVTLSGSGFNADYTQNTVLFGSVAAVPEGGGVNYLNVEVPPAAATGQTSLAVVANGDTSGTVPFTVLVPTNTSADQVIGTVSSGAAIRSVTISPDGSVAYAVGPSSDVVVPIDIDSLVSMPPIGVGSYPISIDMHPDGDWVYVANYQSGDISVIDADILSPGYHTVDSTLAAQGHPVDLVVTSDGDRVYAVLAPPDTNNLVVIDADDQSANWHTVIGTVKTGSVANSVTVSPDGTRLYVGTNDGYVVLLAADNSYAVIGTVSGGVASKSVTISPDGTMLFMLTTQGDVYIYYVEPGSDSENDVIGTVKTGTGTKEVTVSPDGTLLYLIQEQTDLVLVFELIVLGSIGVTGDLPPDLTTSLIDSVYAGEDPEAFVFSPANPNLALVTNSGPQTVTLLNSSFVALEVPRDTVIAPSSTPRHFVLEGFAMTNSSNQVFSYQYLVTTEGPAAFLAGQDTAALEGTTAALAPEGSFVPPAAVLEIPPVRQPEIQRVIYRVSAVENPAFVTRDTATMWFDPMVPVMVAAFEAVPVPAGVQLSWEISSDEEIAGFRVYRRTGDQATDIVVDRDLPPAKRSYVDETTSPDTEYYYTLAVAMPDGSEVLSRSATVRTRPRELTLYQNFPNPFNPTTTIAFSLPSKQHVRLSIYNVEGKLVATLVDQPMTAGYKKVVWRGENRRGNEVSSGIYFYRLTAGKKTLTRKMVLIR
jgi:hypothetical protein